MKDRFWLIVLLVCLALAVAVLVWRFQTIELETAPVGQPTTETVTQDGNSSVMLAAGDIASCANGNDEKTAEILDRYPAATVVTLGDNVYPNGSAQEFRDCYTPSWGRARSRTLPSPGNHDYGTPKAEGYHQYFGDVTGEAGKAYYSYDLGDWHIISLNTNCSVAGCDASSEQAAWLRQDLAANPTTCSLAYFHHPRFSSGKNHGNNETIEPLYQILYDAGAEIVLAGHEHLYERFAPQTPTGQADPLKGLRQFTVGTGGKDLYGFGKTQPNSEARDNTSYGVLKLTLEPSGYTWAFLPAAGSSFTDTGSGKCH